MFEESFDGVLAAARQKEEWAWRTIYRQLAPAVLAFLRVRGAAEPEELTGDVFVQLVRGLPRFEGDARDFRAWVFTIARNKLVDDARYRGRRPLELSPVVEMLEPEPAGDVEEEAMERLSEERFRQVIGHLSDDQRDVILLRVFGDLSVDQVAKAVGKSPGAVKALQHRAIGALKRHLTQLSVTL